MTEREQLLKAHALLKARRYDEARPLLKALPNNPQAQQWLAKLDQIAPELEDPFFEQAASTLDLRMTAAATLFIGGQVLFWGAFFLLPFNISATGGVSAARMFQTIAAFWGQIEMSPVAGWGFLIPGGMLASGVARLRWGSAGLLALMAALGYVILFLSLVGSAFAIGFWGTLVGCALTIASAALPRQNRF